MPGHPALDIWTMVYSATDADYRWYPSIPLASLTRNVLPEQTNLKMTWGLTLTCSLLTWRRRRTSRSSGKSWRRGGWKESPWMVSCAKRSIRNFFGTLCIKGHKICFQSLNLSLSSFIFLQISQIKKSNKMFQPWHACSLWAQRNYPVRRKSLASAWRWGTEMHTMTI